MGRFTVRLPDTLHQELEARARHEGVSLNQYVVYTLTQQITPAYTIQVLPDANVQKQSEQFNALLKRLGTPNKTVAKEFLAEREIETPDDPDVADLIARVEAKLDALEFS